MQHNICVLVLSLLLHVSYTIKVNEFSISGDNEVLNTTLAPKYRVSVPKSKEPLNRVPSHLQGVPYIYKDADDVIHIIEPPQHFQLLKILNNQTNRYMQTQNQQQKIRIIKLKSMNHAPTSIAMKVVTFSQLSAPIYSTKVNKQPDSILKRAHKMQQQFGGNIYNRSHGATFERQNVPVTSKENSADLLSQGTKMQHVQVLPRSPLQLPREVLASVRKTDRLIFLQQLPDQTQRVSKHHKTLKSHTVIMDKRYEHNQFERGTEQKSMGKKWRCSRIRRDVRRDDARRIDQESAALDALKNAKIQVQKGEVVDFSSKQSTNVDLNAERKSLSYPANVKLQKFDDTSLNVTDSILKRHFLSNRVRCRDIIKGLKTKLNMNSRIFDKPSKSRPNNHTAGILLYEDVMSNIQNIFQANDLKIKEDQHKTNFNGKNVSLTLNQSTTSFPLQSDDSKEVKEIEDYIYELHRLLRHLPSTNISMVYGVNYQEITNTTAPANWNLVKDKAIINSENLGFKSKPSISLFTIH
ncbi:uncharacterized protein [Eurosta solidaginis]|uniref:uncharacterized protein isoform X2 n=1 Tax=Eurosta solidaginis TaxID=178769 RepID=UPI0035310EC0